MSSFAVKDVYDYLRAIIKTREKSERALELTKDAASLNPANYTVWQYRLVIFLMTAMKLHYCTISRI